jgi:hypothetical protein
MRRFQGAADTAGGCSPNYTARTSETKVGAGLILTHYR